MTDQEIKDLKDGVPNYPTFSEPVSTIPLEYLCGECTGSGIMLGFYPCKPCGGKGYIVPEPEIIGEVRMMSMSEIQELAMPPVLEDIKKAWTQFLKDKTYPNERELALLNNRIATLKAQLSKELQKKKSERSQRDINQLQQSINTLTKWKNQKK